MSKIPIRWIKKMQPNEEQQRVAEIRYGICKGCNLYLHLKYKRAQCIDCGCYIQHKIYSGGGCPLNKWER